jgi:glycine dehydrogenase subunit 1
MTFIPHTPAQRAQMLAAIGVDDMEQLLDTIPPALRLKRELAVPAAQGEVELAADLQELLAQNQYIPPQRVFAGGGLYPHHVPAVVDELAHRGEFYTAYTPYQPEVSQGMLQCIYEYQSYICLLTGMEISNASAYDGGTALADAAQMALASHRGQRHKLIFAPHVDPQYREVVRTYNIGMELELAQLAPVEGGFTCADRLNAQLDDNTTAVVFQYPDCLGYLDDELATLFSEVHKRGALVIVLFYPFAAGLLKTPGELGADIVCGEAQCLGNYMGFGGPLLGFLACSDKLVRVLPGRLIGRTICERDGQPGEGFVMTLQAREQHIRRAKATSNICSNEALLALRTCIYMGSVGRSGFAQLAALCHSNACLARERLLQLTGLSDFYPNRQFFNEFTLRFPPGKRDLAYGHALKHGLLAGLKPDASEQPELGEALTFAFTEVHRENDLRALVDCLQEVL